MADTKTSALTVFSVDAEDLLYAVDDPSSTPTSGKILASSLMFNRYKLVVTVATNDLTVKVTHPDGNNPSSARPLYFKIGDTIRSAVAALSITIVDGTNWFNSGSAELGTLAVSYFAYVVWDSDSSAVALTIGRKAHYKIVDSGMTTTTSENHIYNYANFTDGDDMENIGYFEAILSLSGTSHLWTVPTFTNLNLRHEQTLSSRILSWTPTLSRSGGAYSNDPTLGSAGYQIINKRVFYGVQYTQHATPGSSGYQSVTLPLLALASSSGSGLQLTDVYNMVAYVAAATLAGLRLWKYDGTAEAVAEKVYGAFGNYYI